MEQYIASISSLNSPSFQDVRKVAINSISHLTSQERDELWRSLKRGTALLDRHETMCQYLSSYGNMHEAKLREAFKNLDQKIFEGEIEIIDWGCGQGIGTMCLIDHIRSINKDVHIGNVTLIEPAEAALNRAEVHLSNYIGVDTSIKTFSRFFEDITPSDFESSSRNPVIHIFSNILDVAQIDLKHLANTLNNSVYSENHVVCVGPLNPNNRRINAFHNYFNVDLSYSDQSANFKSKNWTYKGIMFKLDPVQVDRLIPIEYYPPVKFLSAYRLDSSAQYTDNSVIQILSDYSKFKIHAPFDMGASVYNDVHPIFAVLNNIICRGIPTKASPYIESEFSKAFNKTSAHIELGSIDYIPKEEENYPSLINKLDEGLDLSRLSIDDKIQLQELFSPVAIAQFQKLIIEALLTDQINLDSKSWKFLVLEKDVPFAHLAIKDFKELFENLTQLSKSFDDLLLPEIRVDVISNKYFHDSLLQLGEKTLLSKNASITNCKYDLVLEFSLFQNEDIKKEAFSEFLCANNCYFNIQNDNSATIVDRNIYTSDLIEYKDLLQRSETGSIENVLPSEKYLQYFLRLLFRKESFRDGQLPILERALQNKPVIGLLPTGGGKSLTYQLAGLLQPGVTVVIDPLISLMVDQNNGLLSNGIDCCTYINSSVDKKERQLRESRLESSQLLFVFLSPERLSILDFRRRLSHMHDYNVYFSYAVIDEVHCVSEWGHDFKFSYLHLGRNLYNYVRAKKGHISLFGLTATASFDVLADVERELSGNGAFDLDTDTIVRYENTNRLELQYKVERVPVKFAEDQYFDRNNRLDKGLPKSININSSWIPFESKNDFLKNYLKQIPSHLNELLNDISVNQIKARFYERQNTVIKDEADLYCEVEQSFLDEKDLYRSAGIVFCPHVRNTGISVQEIKENLSQDIVDLGTYAGGNKQEESLKALDSFRNNQSPLMVATKAFGMGIDKPNVRFTVNMNYSSSLEGFVQEAGRAGRDKKMALSVILFSDYRIARLRKDSEITTFPSSIIKGKWFYSSDLKKILNHYTIKVEKKDYDIATPESDFVNLHCHKDNSMFAFNECSNQCSAFSRCTLKNAPPKTRTGWHLEKDLIAQLKSEGLGSLKRHFRFMNVDYGVNMHFYNSNFKGDIIEKTFMHYLLSVYNLQVINIHNQRESIKGFLNALIHEKIGNKIIVYVPYIDTGENKNNDDIAKAIYRLCCIDLIEDFTQDYRKKEYRIVVKRKAAGGYFEGIHKFLLRYYTGERALLELNKTRNYPIKHTEDEVSITTEIHRCLGYLTEFIYEKISEKRKRAINDIRGFCLEGLDESISWQERNENLKDYIYYYFNSKFAKTDYVTDSGIDYSLTNDTDGGKSSEIGVLLKYLKVTDDEVVGIGTPLDNIKHLQGAVRLIRRSLTDSNPVLAILNAFTIYYLGVKSSDKLREQAKIDYLEGMTELGERAGWDDNIWDATNEFNNKLKGVLSTEELESLSLEFKLTIIEKRINIVHEKYLN